VSVSAFGLTDVGRKRRHNEDAYLLDAERGLFVVADGMGGHAAGEVASRITVESIQEYIAATEEEHESSWPFGFNSRVSLEGNRLTTAIEKANEKVMRAVQNRPELKGMGTTVVAALFDVDRATLVHVGDSRAYLFQDGRLEQISRDHTCFAEEVRRRLVTEEAVALLPIHHLITRSLGARDEVDVDLFWRPWQPGSTLLLATDGLHGIVDELGIATILASRQPADAVRALIDTANEAGAPDNVTALVVRSVPPAPRARRAT